MLRPGGLVLLCEVQATMFDASCNPIDPFHPDVRRRSFVALFNHCVRNAMEIQGCHPNPPDGFEAWLTEAGYESVTVDDVWAPATKWYPEASRPARLALSRLSHSVIPTSPATTEQRQVNLIGELAKRNAMVSVLPPNMPTVVMDF
jgi:hypothetical protein